MSSPYSDANIPADMMSATPTRLLWVDDDAAAGGNGTADAPFKTIQEAVVRARPGTAIMVREGTYNENVKLPRTVSGTADAPIWLISADGPQKAHIIAPKMGDPAIAAGGTENFIIDGFWVTGGHNGIQVSQNGFDWTDTIKNIVVQNNLVDGVVQDGIKINGGDNILVYNNVVKGGNDENIDFVSVSHGAIVNNDVSGNTGTSAAIFAKAGSEDIKILGNYVHDTTATGISIGGWSNPDYVARPGYEGFEAKDVLVSGNRIENVGKTPISFFGAQDSVVTNNFLQATDHYFTAVYVGPSNPQAGGAFQSGNVAVTDNVITRDAKQLYVDPASGGVDFSGNTVSNVWAGAVGSNMALFHLPGSIADPASPAADPIPPVQSDPTPAPSDPTPSTAPSDPAPVQSDPTPVTTAPADSTPAPSDTTPPAAAALPDATPMPSEPTSVTTTSTDPTPAPTDPAASVAATPDPTPSAPAAPALPDPGALNLSAAQAAVQVTWANSAAYANVSQTSTGTSDGDLIKDRGGALAGGAGDDTYIASAKGIANIVEQAGGGVDTVLASGRYLALPDQIENLHLQTTLGATLVGNGGDNIIQGNSGADFFAGGGGHDQLTGGGGNDTFFIAPTDALTRITDFTPGDVVSIAGSPFATFADLQAASQQVGSDTVVTMSDGHYIVLQNVVATSLTAADFDFAEGGTAQAGLTATHHVSVNATSHIATGTSDADLVYGTGSGVLVGGDGNDSYIIKDPGDHIVEHAGGGIDTVLLFAPNYTMEANVENVKVRIDTGATVDGNNLANLIVGGDGADVIRGAAGADVLTGGGGADRFVYGTIKDGGDIVTDFQQGVDKLDFHELKGQFADLAITSQDTSAGLAVYADHGGAHDLMVVLAGVHTPLSAADLVL